MRSIMKVKDQPLDYEKQLLERILWYKGIPVERNRRTIISEAVERGVKSLQQPNKNTVEVYLNLLIRSLIVGLRLNVDDYEKKLPCGVYNTLLLNDIRSPYAVIGCINDSSIFSPHNTNVCIDGGYNYILQYLLFDGNVCLFDIDAFNGLLLADILSKALDMAVDRSFDNGSNGALERIFNGI